MDQNKELREILTKAYRNGDFVFVPFGKLPELNGLFIPIYTEVKPKITDFYNAQGKFGQHHFALMILADAAGIHWSSEGGNVGRVDNRNNPNYCSFRVVAKIRTPEGLWSEQAAHKHLDIDAKREAIEIKHAEAFDFKSKFGGGKGPTGYPVKKPWPSTKDEYVKKFTERDVNQLRENMDERCESGAQVRAIKNILHLPSAWPAGNDGKPACINKSFFIVKYILDPQNPQVQAAQLQSFQQAITGIYGAPPALPQPKQQLPEPKDITPKKEKEQPVTGGYDTDIQDFEAFTQDDMVYAIKMFIEFSDYPSLKDDELKNGPLDGWTTGNLIEYFKFLKTRDDKR